MDYAPGMHLDTTAKVIDKLGGVHAVAELTDTNYKAAHAWKQRGRFPAKTFVVITEALRRKGLSARSNLWKMVGGK